MLTRNELNSIPIKVRNIRRSKARIEKMRAKLYSPQGFDDRERVQTSGGQRDELVDMVLDFESLMQAEQREVDELSEQARAMFERLDPEPKQLMTLRYIEALSWPEIAEVMMYAPPTLFKKHRQILDTLYPEGEETE